MNRILIAAALTLAPRVEIRATEQGFDPALVVVKKGERIRFVVTRITENAPAKEIVLDEAIFFKELPLNRAVSVAFTPGKTGEFPYTSGNGSVRGVLRVDD
ncbi:MAG TPA: cupredoxin domain-containing protein [Anaeromyxobacteraceae bacterium]|jgi:plastocyanin domain-containing protein|nr:cupredoxin domain-containing protein [Anaeromyxobacteraceae bacterium]